MTARTMMMTRKTPTMRLTMRVRCLLGLDGAALTGALVAVLVVVVVVEVVLLVVTVEVVLLVVTVVVLYVVFAVVAGVAVEVV